MIYIMRHGQSSIDIEHRINYRRRDGDLTDTGREQVLRAAHWLMQHSKIRAIYTSPYAYTRAAADMVGQVLGITAKDTEDLREIDTGTVLEGRTDEDAWLTYRALFTRWLEGEQHVRFPGGETLAQAYERTLRAIIGVSTQHDDDMLLVTHGNLMRCVLPSMCVNAAALQRVDIPDHAAFVIFSRYETGGFACESWNLIEHLA